MPLLIPETDFSDQLRRPSTNKAAAKKFLTKYPKPYQLEGFIIPEGYRFVTNKKGKQIRLIDKTDSSNPRIIYAVNIELSDKKIGQRSCTQVMVWSDPVEEELTIGLPKKVFSALLEEYVIMISDEEQTNDGKRFWERRLIQSLKNGHFVYFYDSFQLGSQLIQINTVDEFLEEYEPLGWGQDNEHKGKMFIISKMKI
ncbi:hypothetical protein [Aliivibrio logei]|uniref:hypothetical protein n=1 Tax=Aliivibrio logei TaxID=688 RepID=UPI0035C8CCD9